MTILDTIKERFTSDWRQVDWRRTFFLVVLVLAVAAVLWQYLMPDIREVNTTTFRRMKEIRTVKNVQRVYIPCPEKGLVVLDHAEAAKRLGMPELQVYSTPSTESIRSTGATPAPSPVEVLSTAALPQTDNGHQVVAVLDTDTGVTTMVAKEVQAPWFRFTNKGAAGLRYGLNQRLEYAGTAYGRWDFLRVKDVYFSLNADLETGGDAHLQAGAEYRW